MTCQFRNQCWLMPSVRLVLLLFLAVSQSASGIYSNPIDPLFTAAVSRSVSEKWKKIIQKPLINRASFLDLGRDLTEKSGRRVESIRIRLCKLSEEDQNKYLEKQYNDYKLKTGLWLRYRDSVEKIIRENMLESGITEEPGLSKELLSTMIRLAIERDQKRLKAIQCGQKFDPISELAFFEAAARFFAVVPLSARVKIASELH